VIVHCGLAQHRGRGIERDDARLWPVGGESRCAMARAAAEVEDRLWREADPPEPIDHLLAQLLREDGVLIIGCARLAEVSSDGSAVKEGRSQMERSLRVAHRAYRISARQVTS